jgi:pimeloyl-ACP methyl ester carboxylesterase
MPVLVTINSKVISMKELRTFSRWCMAMMLGALLWSCGGSADPLAVFKNQIPDWQACDPARVGEANQKLLTLLAQRTRCADIRVPRDYANPSKGEMQVALLRVNALHTAERRSAILINPGGPGGDGLPYPLMLAAYWAADGTTDAAIVPLYQAMAQRFDLIGFSPRGIGASTQLECVRQRELRFVADPTRDLSAGNTDNTLYNSQVIAEACRDNALAPDINTDATARDMDLIRHLLGEDKLNYIGLSYGTWLGNWYASLFPQRVGRMLLSGVTDFSEPLNHQTLQQEGGLQRVLDEVLIPYAVAHPQRFGNLAANSDEVHAMLASLPNALHYATVNTLSETHALSESTLADVAVMTLLATKVIKAQLDTNPGMGEQSLRQLIAAYSFLPQKDLDDNAHLAAAAVSKSYFLQTSGKTEAKDESMFWAIVCNDSGTGFTPQSWVQASNRNAALYPDFGGYMRDNACLYWKPSGITRPPQANAASAGAILLLQAELDPLTVLSGARKSLSLLPNARMIEISGEYSHAPLPPYGTACVDKPIAQYFLDGTPGVNTSCSRRALPAEQ